MNKQRSIRLRPYEAYLLGQEKFQQVRRIVKGDPVFVTPLVGGPLGGSKVPTGEFGLHFHNDRVINKHVRCPYGDADERLWVRESFWQQCQYVNAAHPESGCNDPVVSWEMKVVFDEPNDLSAWRKRPSVHMPRWASRAEVEVVDVRVERLHDISREDCRAEGMVLPPTPGDTTFYKGFDELRSQYAMYWEEIHGKGSWSKNPFVWRINLKKT